VSTLILVLCLRLLACMAVGAVAVTAVLLIHLWRLARRTDAYEPAAAEVPESDTAAAEAVEAFFTDAGVPVVPDAQGDHLTQSFESKLYELLARADAGEDITAGAPREQL
jgi:hypothetical protein